MHHLTYRAPSVLLTHKGFYYEFIVQSRCKRLPLLLPTALFRLFILFLFSQQDEIFITHVREAQIKTESTKQITIFCSIWINKQWRKQAFLILKSFFSQRKMHGNDRFLFFPFLRVSCPLTLIAIETRLQLPSISPALCSLFSSLTLWLPPSLSLQLTALLYLFYPNLLLPPGKPLIHSRSNFLVL